MWALTKNVMYKNYLYYITTLHIRKKILSSHIDNMLQNSPHSACLHPNNVTYCGTKNDILYQLYDYSVENFPLFFSGIFKNLLLFCLIQSRHRFAPAQTQCSSIFSINIPYPFVGSFTNTWVTAPIILPFCRIGLPDIP